jgi:hypothetical protein
MTDYGEWTTDQFCEQCRTLLSEYMDKLKPRGWITWGVESGSTCALCRFLQAILGDSRHVTMCVLPVPLIMRGDIAPFSVPNQVGLRTETTREVLSVLDFYNERLNRIMVQLSYVEGERNYPILSTQLETNIITPHGETRLPYHQLQKDSADINFLKSCIEGCKALHVELCGEPDAALLSSIVHSPGFRLIDCVDETVTMAPEVSEYVALSYVWGGVSTARADETNSHGRLGTNLPSDLPSTIIDAMKATLLIGYRYLWVDKYCISQNPGHADFETQLGQMDLIYHGAAVTIIAAAGNDADYGLPGVGHRPRDGHPRIKINDTTWIAGYKSITGPIEDSNWSTRGWVSVTSPILCCITDLASRLCRHTKRITSPADDYFSPRNKLSSNATLAGELNLCPLPWEKRRTTWRTCSA